MRTLKEAAEEFLALKRIAVAGVSRNGDLPANAIFRKLRNAGYEVYPVNPRADNVEGVKCYPDIASIPGGVDGVVIATHPAVTLQLVRECSQLGVKHVWMHRSFGQGSVDEEAVRLGREQGLSVIPGSCPMMFCDPVDFPHRCMRWWLHVTGTEAEPAQETLA
jgi:predicted CoA-binding protein